MRRVLLTMRVLEVMGSLHRGGAETMIMNYYKAMDKSLCQMDFVVHAEFEEDYRKQAQEYGARVFLLERPGKIGALAYIKALTQLIKSNGPYDAIHIHTNHQAFLSMIAGRIAGVKNILVHSHTTKYEKKYLAINRFFMKMCRVKRIACGKAAGDAFFGKENYIVITNAIDLRKFKEVTSCDEKKYGSKYVVGHLGRLTKPKNHEFIIGLAEQMAKVRDDIVFVCYGEGEDEEKLKRIVGSKQLSNIKFLGVTHDAASAYHSFDVFILPSLWEGFPVTLVESQLAGTYALASDKVSKECDLNIGMLKFLPLDIEAWKNEIISCISQDHMCLKNKTIVDLYDVNIQWRKLYQLYCK